MSCFGYHASRSTLVSDWVYSISFFFFFLVIISDPVITGGKKKLHESMTKTCERMSDDKDH